MDVPKWRVGVKFGRLVYLNGRVMGLMNSRRLAEQVVRALSSQEEEDSLDRINGKWSIFMEKFDTFKEKLSGIRQEAARIEQVIADRKAKGDMSSEEETELLDEVSSIHEGLTHVGVAEEDPPADPPVDPAQGRRR